MVESDKTERPESHWLVGALRRVVHVVVGLVIWSAAWLVWVIAYWWDSTSDVPTYVYAAAVPLVAFLANVLADRGRVTRVGLVWMFVAALAGAVIVVAFAV